MERDWFVYLPFGASYRNDLLVEDPTGLVDRAQCKTGRLKESIIFFATCSRTGNVDRDYRSQTDYFAVYCHPRREVYLVPVEHVASRACHLRMEGTRNGQASGIRWAKRYLFHSWPAGSGA